MKIVRSWLKEFLPELPKTDRLEEMLAGLGIETEDVQRLAPPPSKAVFAKVLHVEPIAGKEVRKMVLDIGHQVQVVSGAPNARPGIGVVLAMPGTVLASGEVGLRSIAGVESFGMALSAKELGIGEYAGGLMELDPQSLAPGTPLAEIWEEDEVLTIEITPNRPDWLSVYGVARDLSALGLERLKPAPKTKKTPLALPFGAWVDDLEGCSRFTLSYATVAMGFSPLSVQRRLYAAGMRPISNVVDATNYAMLELGNPIHAYDVSQIGEGLYVRRATQGEQLTTLDGQDRQLSPQDLLITTKHGSTTKPAGLAGVMGGAHDEISQNTTAIALEVAHFDPVSIRRTAKRQGLKTEASYRFERGVDPGGLQLAASRCLGLLQEWSNIEIAQDYIDLDHTQPAKAIVFRPQRTSRLVGMPFETAQQLEVLGRLDCQIEPAGDAYAVSTPSYRVDLHLEEDLIEEVVRIVGYDKIPLTLPSFFPSRDSIGVSKPYQDQERLKDVFAGLGFQEVVNYSWSSPEECTQMFAPAPTVFMSNPQTPDRTALRTRLYPGLIKNLQGSLAQGEQGPFLLFELGNVFGSSETSRLCALLSGDVVPGIWQPGLQGGFFALKGLLEAAAISLGARLQVLQETFDHLHPGISGAVYWEGQKIGSIGALHPAIIANTGIPAAFVFELELPLPKAVPGFADVSKYPASLRDLAIVVPEQVTYAALETIIRLHAGEWLSSVEVFDVYRGKPLQEGQKSLAFHLVFRHPEHTLTDLETDSFMQAIIATVEASGYSIRR
jgi:phenylalanyl-tRNA synthetase beta chain